MFAEQLTRQEWWRRRYLARPYLKDATNEQLADRLRYIIENFTTLTSEGKIGFLSPEPYGGYWLELATHVLEAYHARGTNLPPNFLKDSAVPRPTKLLQPQIEKALADAKLPSVGTYFVKFGERKYMRSLHEKGELKIAPASSFSDSSLNAALRDNELTLSAFALRSEIRMEAFDHKTGKSKGRIEPLGNVTVTSESQTDYYVYCLGTILDPRLFGNFGYDACVIFPDKAGLRARIHDAMRTQRPGWVGYDQAVNYLDPYNCKKEEMNVFVSKHHRYWYQREYRFGWLPPSTIAPPIPNLFLELGDMRGSSILIEL